MRGGRKYVRSTWTGNKFHSFESASEGRTRNLLQNLATSPSVEFVHYTAPINRFPPPGRGIQIGCQRLYESQQIPSSPVAEAVIEHCTTSERFQSFSTKRTYSWLKGSSDCDFKKWSPHGSNVQRAALSCRRIQSHLSGQKEFMSSRDQQILRTRTIRRHLCEILLHYFWISMPSSSRTHGRLSSSRSRRNVGTLRPSREAFPQPGAL